MRIKQQFYLNYLRPFVRLALALAITMVVVEPGFCNNLAISNGALTDQDESADTIKVDFDLAWDNSWLDSTNYDATWLFIKYSTDAGKTWSHATLKTSGTDPDGFSVGSGTPIEIIVPADKKGCFIKRSESGTGTLSTSEIQLVWDYGQDGVSDEAVNSIDTRIKIFGIEMVYMPEGSFLAGDEDSDMTACFKGGKVLNAPISITSGAAILFTDEDNGPYYYQSAGNTGEWVSGATFTISAAFPKGYSAFYLMKYEISQGQWIDFFNTLTDGQKATRDITSSAANGKNSDAVVKRNTVSWASSGDAVLVNGREHDRACNFLSWMDLCAYADWAALRPMTELEFEKACRGPGTAYDDEYAWGNRTITAAGSILGTENGTETIMTPGANCCYNDTTFTGGDGGKGPLRCGIFATSSSARPTSGAGYYGVMELSGNVWERCVSAGNPAGLNFIGSHGDGALTDAGNATNSDWPGIDTSPENGVTGAGGSGFRGGSWFETTLGWLTVADRGWAVRTDTDRSNSESNYWGYGGRCSKTAP